MGFRAALMVRAGGEGDFRNKSWVGRGLAGVLLPAGARRLTAAFVCSHVQIPIAISRSGPASGSRRSVASIYLHAVHIVIVIILIFCILFSLQSLQFLLLHP